MTRSFVEHPVDGAPVVADPDAAADELGRPGRAASASTWAASLPGSHSSSSSQNATSSPVAARMPVLRAPASPGVRLLRDHPDRAVRVARQLGQRPVRLGLVVTPRRPRSGPGSPGRGSRRSAARSSSGRSRVGTTTLTVGCWLIGSPPYRWPAVARPATGVGAGADRGHQLLHDPPDPGHRRPPRLVARRVGGHRVPDGSASPRPSASCQRLPGLAERDHPGGAEPAGEELLVVVDVLAASRIPGHDDRQVAVPARLQDGRRPAVADHQVARRPSPSAARRGRGTAPRQALRARGVCPCCTVSPIGSRGLRVPLRQPVHEPVERVLVGADRDQQPDPDGRRGVALTPVVASPPARGRPPVPSGPATPPGPLARKPAGVRADKPGGPAPDRIHAIEAQQVPLGNETVTHRPELLVIHARPPRCRGLPGMPGSGRPPSGSNCGRRPGCAPRRGSARCTPPRAIGRPFR